MSSVLMKCNLDQEEQERVFREFDKYLDREEEEALRLKFRQYCFYDTWGRKNYRDCMCTRCGAFDLYKDEDPDFFRLHHGDEICCPNCGEYVELYSLGRMRTGATLKEWQRAAFVRKASDGGVLLVAGYATVDYSPYELRPVLDWNVKSLTYLAPGKRMQWRRKLRNYYNMFYQGSGEFDWVPAKTVEEPFKPAMNENYGSYWLMGYTNILDTSLKYCQMEDWYYAVGEGWLCEEGNRIRQAYKYLARYTEYPQMEMAVKLGMCRAVEELVMDGRKNHRLLDWSAKTVQGFLRMNKQDAKAFVQVGGDIRQLEHCHDTLKTGTVKSVQEYLQLVQQIGSMDCMKRAAVCAERAGVDIRRAVKYILRQAESQTGNTAANIGRTITYWKDYLDAAETLDFDLTEETVSMPKNLIERHDTATQMVKLQASAEARKKYNKRYQQLRNLYEFRLGDLCIVVPENGEEIVAEGKTLQHCVGGYAGRHLEGKVDILFLRHARKPNRSFLTIEMVARKTISDKITLVQIHGYKNESYKNSPENPRTKYAWFLDAWMNWQRHGSKRDKNGNPIIQDREEQSA